MDLNKEFQQFVGLIIKDPKRVTCDTDPEADKITSLAQKFSLYADFYNMDEPQDPFMFDVEAVHIGYTKDGVPGDKSWGYRVAQINVG